MEKDTQLELYTNNIITSYQNNIEPYLEDIELALKEGLSIKDICLKLKVDTKLFLKYRKLHPELNMVVLRGADKTIKRLEKTLLKAAYGYKTKKIKKAFDSVGNLLGTHEEEYEISPNVNALVFALCNLKAEKYSRQDKVIEDEGKNTIIIKMPEQFDKWAD